MDDFRQAAIDAIVNTVSEIGLHDNSEVARYGATFRQHEIIDIIEGMPSAEPRWIPVTERLPKENGDYLVTGRHGAVNKRKYEDERWYGNWAVIAWMPLPEPWKGEE